jgi:S1-C subfamily serine protease
MFSTDRTGITNIVATSGTDDLGTPWPAPAWPPPPRQPPTDQEPVAPLPPRRRRHWGAIVAAAALVAAGAGAAGVRTFDSSPSSASSALSSASHWSAQTLPTPSTSATAALGSTEAVAAAVEPAVVDITTQVPGGEAAGTGMILTASGLVLTNNHVIEDATSIEVQISGTGPTYGAEVVGYDVTDDIAVLQLDGASGLSTISVGDSTGVKMGDAVIAIGNALGQAGPETVTSGTVTALEQSITASAELGGDAETLEGLIESNATLQPGDSGGALVNSAGQVIGMNTAAETSGRFTSASNVGYAIPIDDALALAQQIVDSQSSATVHIGDRAVLGVSIASTGPSATAAAEGATVVAVQDASPAATAGIAAGDTVTAIDATTITALDDLAQALAPHQVGDQVKVTWTAADGTTGSATVALVAGPPA